MTKVLHGWQRIGIVISVLWLLSVVVFVAVEYDVADKYRYLNEGQRQHFVYWSAAVVVDPFDLHIGEDVNQFSDREQLELLRKRKNVAESMSLRIFHWRVIGWIFIPIVGGWVLSYTTVFVIRWVRAGFTPTNP